ncbi:MAG: carbonic anhydrase [Planctomycetota bacterium]
MKFASVINCMDGRVQIPVIEWIIRQYGVNYVDMITEAGPNKILADNKNRFLLESIKKRIEISVNKHASKLIAIVGHYDCAGNPVEKDNQLQHILSAVKIVESWNFDAQIIGLWVNEKWEVCSVAIPLQRNTTN